MKDNVKYIILTGLCLLIIADILAMLSNSSSVNAMSWVNFAQFIALIGLSFLATTKPYIALLASLMLFVLCAVFSIINAENVIGGLAVKIFVLLYFSKYLPFAKSLQHHKQELAIKAVA